VHMTEKSSLLQSQKGNSLIMVMLLVAVMSILGISLFSIVFSGFNHASLSEAEIQSEALAQSGLDEAVVLIQHAIDQNNTSNTDYRTLVSSLSDQIQAIIGDLDGETVRNDKGSYTWDFNLQHPSNPLMIMDQSVSDWEKQTGMIENPVVHDILTLPIPDYPYVYQIVVKVIGTAKVKNDSNNTMSMTKEMRMYVNTLNPVYRYPVSASETLSLNGGSRIIGDVFVDGDVTVNQQVTYNERGIQKTVDSGLPSLRGFMKLQNGSYISDDGTDYGSSFNPSMFSNQDIVFDDQHMIADQLMNIGEMDCSGCADAYVTKVMSIIPSLYPVTSAPPVDEFSTVNLGSAYGVSSYNSLRISDQWYQIGSNDDASELMVAGNWIIQNGVLAMEHEHTDSDPSLQRKAPKLQLTNGSIYVQYDDPSIVAADLTGTIDMEPGQIIAVSGNTTLTNFTLENGQMFIEGNLRISGNLQINKGSIYVDGNVEFVDSDTINTSSISPLNIIASGTITFSSVRPSTDVHAFLYSKQDMNVYGVVSKMNIIGGIHAKNVAIHSVRGVVTSDLLGNYTFEPNQTLLPSSASRLQIIYENSLFTNPPYGLPVTGTANLYIQRLINVR
jgi:hypothetical protein